MVKKKKKRKRRGEYDIERMYGVEESSSYSVTPGGGSGAGSQYEPNPE